MKHIFLFLITLTISHSVKIPPNFKKCNRRQPDFKQCVLEAVKNAIPQLVKPFKEINIPNLEPLEVPEVQIGAGTGNKAVEQNFKNCKFYGFNNFQVDRFEFGFDTKTLDVAGIFPKIQMKCSLVEINGTGTVILENVKSACLLIYEEVPNECGCRTFMKFVQNELNIEPSSVSFKFDNVLDATDKIDKEVDDDINQALSENWREVFGDVKKDYVRFFNKILLKLFDDFFSKVSMEEAFDQ